MRFWKFERHDDSGRGGFPHHAFPSGPSPAGHLTKALCRQVWAKAHHRLPSCDQRPFCFANLFGTVSLPIRFLSIGLRLCSTLLSDSRDAPLPTALQPSLHDVLFRHTSMHDKNCYPSWSAAARQPWLSGNPDPTRKQVESPSTMRPGAFRFRGFPGNLRIEPAKSASRRIDCHRDVGWLGRGGSAQVVGGGCGQGARIGGGGRLRAVCEITARTGSGGLRVR